jgi:hypothetical protein
VSFEKFNFLFHAQLREFRLVTTLLILKLLKAVCDESLEHAPQIDKRTNTDAVSCETNRSMKFRAVFFPIESLSIAPTFVVSYIGREGNCPIF